MADNDITDTLIMIGVVVIVLAVIISISSTIITTSDDTAQEVQNNALLDGQNWVTIADTVGQNPTVYDSRGYAINLTGTSDSYFESTEPIALETDENWTVSAWGSQDTISDTNETLLSVKGEIIIGYDGAANNWTVWFYDSSTRDSYNFTVDAIQHPYDLTNVVLTRTNNTLTLYENTTKLYTKDISSENIASSPTASNWDGRIEEVRMWTRGVNATELSEHNSDPIDAIPDNATARVMFDEPYRSNQLLLYNSGSIATSNATYSNGFAGQKLDRNRNSNQADYEWQDNGPQIRAVAGGEIEDAPVAYVDYLSKPLFSEYVKTVNSTIGMAMIVLLVVPIAVIVAYLRLASNTR